MAGEWPLVTVGELAKSISDTHKMDKEHLIFLNTSDILLGKVLHRTYTLVRDWPGQAKKSIRRDDILFSEIRPANGRWAFIDFEADDYVVSTKLMVIRVDKSRVIPRFLYHFLTSAETTRWLQHLAESRSGTFPQITFDQVTELEIALPPLGAQAEIAKFLDDIEEKIDLNRRMNETLEAMARVIFKSWFVNFDPVRAKAERRAGQDVPMSDERHGWRASRPTDPGLPKPLADLFPDSFENSELGEIPKGWKVGRLDEVTDFLGGYAFKSKDWTEQGVPVVKIGSVKPGIVDLNAVSYVSGQVAKAADRFRLAPGDLLIGMTGYVGEVGLVPRTDNPPLLNQRVGKFVLEKPGTAALAFLYCLTRKPEFKAQVETKSHGTAQANVSAEGILSIQIVVPPKCVRDEFNRIGQPLLDRILTNHCESSVLATHRDTLLPKLISGELRVNQAERLVAEDVA